MNPKILTIFLIAVLIPVFPFVSAQEVNIGEKAQQKSVTVTISNEGDIHVKHVVRSLTTPKQMELIDGTVQNLKIVDDEGEEQIVTIIGDNDAVMLMPSNNDLIIEYDLEDVLTLEDGFWTWNFLYLESTAFIIPEKADLIFVNENPVLMGDKKGFVCHGCQMVLEYSFDEPKILENTKWEDKEFDVEIRTSAELDKFTFEQSEKSLSFDVLDENKFVTIFIPLELLWEPYTVFLNDEKIETHQFLNNGTHVGLSMKPTETGKITIIGTTVVPEFPIFAPLAIGLMAILTVPLLRRINLR